MKVQFVFQTPTSLYVITIISATYLFGKTKKTSEDILAKVSYIDISYMTTLVESKINISPPHQKKYHIEVFKYYS